MKRFRVQAQMATLAGKSAPLAQFDTPKEAHAFALVREKNGATGTTIVDIEAKEALSVTQFAAKHRLR